MDNDFRFEDVILSFAVQSSMVGTESRSSEIGIFDVFTESPTYLEVSGKPSLHLVNNLNIYTSTSELVYGYESKTIEMNVFIVNENQSNKAIFNRNSAASERFVFDNGTIKYYGDGDYIGTVGNPPINEWFHLCYQRWGSDVYIFIDGILKLKTKFTPSSSNVSGTIALGWGGGNSCDCYISDFQATKGEPRYSSSGFILRNTPYILEFGFIQPTINQFLNAVFSNKETVEQANPQPKKLQCLVTTLDANLIGKTNNYTSLLNQKGEQRLVGYYQSTVLINLLPSSNRRVMCFSNNGQLVDETISDNDGHYRFDHLDLNKKYMFVAQYSNEVDTPPDYAAVAADWQSPIPYKE